MCLPLWNEGLAGGPVAKGHRPCLAFRRWSRMVWGEVTLHVQGCLCGGAAGAKGGVC